MEERDITEQGTPATPHAARSIFTGAGFVVIGRYSVAVLGWAGSLLIFRHLTSEAWGQLSFVLGLLGLVGLLADLRLSRVVIGQVLQAGDRAGDVVGSYVGMRLAIGVVSYLVAMAWVIIGGNPASVVVATAVAGLNLIILSGANAIGLLFQARLWLRSLSTATVIGQAVQFAITVGVVVIGASSVVAFAWATVLNSIVFALMLAFVARRVTGLRFHVELRTWWIWLKEAAPLALGSALDTVYFRIDIVMLSALDSFTAVGKYTVGYKFSDLLGSVALAVVAPATTLLVKHWMDKRPHQFHRTFRHTLILMSVSAIGAAVAFTIYARPLVTLLYTERAASSVDAARLLVVGQALHFFTLLCFITLVAAGRNRLYPIAMLVGVVVNVGLNFALIPAFSFNGSGWATVITEAIVLLVLTLGTIRVPDVLPLPTAPLVKIGIASVAMGVVGWGLLHRAPWPVGLVACGLTYFAVLHFARVDGPGGLRVLASDLREEELDAEAGTQDPPHGGPAPATA